MKNIIILALLFCTHAAIAQQAVRVIKYPELERIIGTKGSQTLVINFWATWCAPCVKELPLFEKVHQADSSVNVYLISLDFAEKADRVKAFVTKKKMTAPVLLLDEIDYNSWIDRVDKSWSGAIPATLVINQDAGKRKFVEKELTEQELEELIKSVQ